MTSFSLHQLRSIFAKTEKIRVVVVGDLILDRYLFGKVHRICPEAPVPVVEIEREEFVPGGAANVARNLTALGVQCSIFGRVGNDDMGVRLRSLLEDDNISGHIIRRRNFPTSVKSRVMAQQQQIIRFDHEIREPLSDAEHSTLRRHLSKVVPEAHAVILVDYAKGIITEQIVDWVSRLCERHNTWLSLSPKPGNSVKPSGVCLLALNRKEAFELAAIADSRQNCQPTEDEPLQQAAQTLLCKYKPKILLITMGELGMLLCLNGRQPRHIPTCAQEVYDVSGAGDTVLAAFTMAVAAGAEPIEAAVFSNHAAGVVVAKIGTATPTPNEIDLSFRRAKRQARIK